MSSSTSLGSALALIANPQTFTGVSKYSADMQSILVRSQQIAQIPVTALQNNQTTLKSDMIALTTLQSAIGLLSTTISSLGSLSSKGALSGTSNNTKVTVAISGAGATSGTYNIGKITSLASVSTATMTNPLADPAANNVAPTDTNTLYLTAGGAQVPIALTALTNNLNGLRDAINGAGAGVSASILTTNQGSYLTLTATVAGATPIKLETIADGSGTNLLSMNNTGSLAQFEVNGKAATSTTNQVNGVIPGVTLTLAGTTAIDEVASVVVTGNSATVATAIQNIAGAYNALNSSIAALTAPGSGALIGSTVIRSVQSMMRQFVFFQGTGSVKSLMDLGVTLDKTGTMTVDSSVLSNMAPGQLSNVLGFIGDGKKGLSAQSNGFNSYADVSTGLIHQNIAQDQVSQQRLQDQIDAMNVRIQLAQHSIMAKLQAADTMLALLTNQQNTLTASIQSLKYTLYGVSTSAG